MRVAVATLIRRDVEGWPDTVIRDAIPIGRLYLVDLDSILDAILFNRDYPEWGTMTVRAIIDISNGLALPLSCLSIEGPIS